MVGKRGGTKSMTLHEAYRDNLEAANRFEDYVERKLYCKGLPVGVYRSLTFQKTYGESRAGIEIKYDLRFRETGNLFIEFAERHNKNVNMKPAGICGKGWGFCIGDYHKIWLFSMTMLKLLHANRSKYRVVEHDTAKGFLLPVEDADKHAIFLITEGEYDVGPDGRPIS